MLACLLPVGSAKPVTCAMSPGCDFAQSAAWLITDCAESSIAADHSWKNTTNFCAGDRRRGAVAAHSSSMPGGHGRFPACSIPSVSRRQPTRMRGDEGGA